jgi:cation diffusion facilitator CzcD-associated flavoprotein CzcO
MNFNSEVVGCHWQQEKGQWNVKIKQTQSDGSTKVIEDYCHVLLHGTGILNNFKWPNIGGLHEFKGKVATSHASMDTSNLSRSFILRDGPKITKRNNGKQIALQS